MYPFSEKAEAPEAVWRALQQGDREAATRQIVETYLWLIRSIAVQVFRDYNNPTLDLRDLIQCGTVGLLSAIGSYDPSHGARFSTFASKRIRGEILDYLSMDTEAAAQAAFRRRVRHERVQSIRSGVTESGSLFHELVDVAVGLAVGFMLEETSMLVVDDTQPDVGADPAHLIGIVDSVQALVEKLPESEARVIRYHYHYELNFSAIARLMGVSQPRISQLHAQALKRLRGFHRSRHHLDLML